MTEQRKFRIYTTPTCHYCHLLKDWMKEQECAFEEIDITKNVGALREWRRLSGGVGVPTTAFGNEIVIGFDTARLEQFVRSCKNSEPVDLPEEEVPVNPS